VLLELVRADLTTGYEAYDTDFLMQERVQALEAVTRRILGFTLES